MGSADFSQFVVTTANETACETSTLKVHALFPHLPATFTGTSSNFWASSLLADLPVFPSLVCGSCSSGQGFPTASFRFHLTMDTLAVQLCTSSLPTRTRDFHPLERAHGAQTKKSADPDGPALFSYGKDHCPLFSKNSAMAFKILKPLMLFRRYPSGFRSRSFMTVFLSDLPVRKNTGMSSV